MCHRGGSFGMPGVLPWVTGLGRTESPIPVSPLKVYSPPGSSPRPELNSPSPRHFPEINLANTIAQEVVQSVTQPTSTTDDSLLSRTDKVGKVVSQPDSSLLDLSQHDTLNRLNQNEEISSQIDSKTDEVPTWEKTLVEPPSGPSDSNSLVSTSEQGSEKVAHPGEAEKPRDRKSVV